MTACINIIQNVVLHHPEIPILGYRTQRNRWTGRQRHVMGQ